MSGNRKSEPVRFAVRAVPNAACDLVVGWQGDALKIKLKAVPEGGRANKALVALVAGKLGVPKRSVSICSGETSRQKLVSVEGISPASFEAIFGRPD